MPSIRRNKSSQNAKGRIPPTIDIVAVEKRSLAEFIKESDIVHLIDARVAKATKLRVVSSDTFIETYAARLIDVGIRTIGEIDQLLRQRSEVLVTFVTRWFLGSISNKQSLIPEGIGISFLCWAIALDRANSREFVEYVKKHGFNKERDLREVARSLERAYNEVNEFLAH